MDEDFRNRYRQDPASQPIGGRPQPHAAPPRPNVYRPPAPQPQPAAGHHQPAHQQPVPHQPVPHYPQPNPGKSKAGLLALVVLAVLGGVFYFLHQAKKPAGNSNLPSNITSSEVSIPVYYPANLPDGFKASNYKVVKRNVLNYVVTNKNNDQFYISILPLPSDSDLAAYKNKLSHQTEYTASSGKVVIGTAGNSLTGSIETTKHDWILFNTTALNKTNDLKTIINSLQPTSL